MKKPKILIYDVETRPNLGYIWGKYEQNVISYVEEWSMISFAYKWLGDKQTHVLALNDFDPTGKDPSSAEKRLIEALHALFDAADIVIAHNGDQFDQKVSNARFIYHGLTPPSGYRSIDTKKVARKYFRFNSNKLDDLGAILGLGRKLQTGGFDLWLGCMANKKSAWNKMKKYNKQDVVLLEKVYLKMRPWIDNHPSMAILAGKPDACPKCGGGPLKPRGTAKCTKVAWARRYRCENCGGWCQSRSTQKTDVQYVN